MKSLLDGHRDRTQIMRNTKVANGNARRRTCLRQFLAREDADAAEATSEGIGIHSAALVLIRSRGEEIWGGP